MTVNEAISQSEVSYPTEADGMRLYAWISELEQRVCQLYGKSFQPISHEDGDRVLCAPDAYAEIYPMYLIMKRELTCGDSERYAFYSERFDRAYKSCSDHASRTAPMGKAVYITTV